MNFSGWRSNAAGWSAVVALLCLLPLSAVWAAEPFLTRDDVRRYVAEIAEQHQLDPYRLANLFAAVEPQQSVLDAISRPAEKALTWAQYRQIFIKPKRVERGREFMQKYDQELLRAEATFGIPASIIAAIIGVETFYGKVQGKHGVLQSLATLAFDYPRRSKFFKSELTEFLILSQIENWDATDVKGSYAGAMGWPQFISSSYREYAIDFDQDGATDLFNSVPDAIGSVANYLRRHGWKPGTPIAEPLAVSDATREATRALNRKSLKPVIAPKTLANLGFNVHQGAPVSVMNLSGKTGEETWVGYTNFYAITRYNHSRLYALAVFQLSEQLASSIQ